MANTRLKTCQEHVYPLGNLGILKLAAIYGANGAGKSNLIKALAMLKQMVLKEAIPMKLKNGQFKFQAHKEGEKQLLAIEFVEENTVLYYGIEILNGIICTEELYESGAGITEDKLIFERKTDENLRTSVLFSEEFEKEAKNQVLKEILLKEFVKPHKPILKLMADRENEALVLAKKAYTWFKSTLTIITPDVKAAGLVYSIETDKNFKRYIDQIMCAFHVGITGLSTQNEKIEDFFGWGNEVKCAEYIEKIEDSPQKRIQFRNKNGNYVLLVKENNEYFAKKLQILHKGGKDISAAFEIEEESDGTIRLLDLVPVFGDLIWHKKAYFIDEIERSLHPLLIKELVKKFSADKDTQGQLVFTTHESHLLDQEIFRQDEIWFAEKDSTGSTDLYSLNSFKEHKTIDIQKGYLNGRYGSIPFLGNLSDLNWHNYVTEK